MQTRNKYFDKLQTKKGMLQASVAAALVVVSTTIALFVYEVIKNKKATKPLGYKAIDKSKIAPIKDRSGDITKDRYHPSKTKLPKNIDYIVIGSGISGLSCAAYLSRVGRRVLVLEQHDRIGGCLHQYDKTYEFDTGIHYIGKVHKYGKLLEPITAKEKKIQFVAMGNKENGYLFDEYIFGKDAKYSFKARAHSRKQDLLQQFADDKDVEAINKFYQLGKQSERLAICVFAGKLLNIRWLSRLLFKFGEYKYSELWNKSAADICRSLFSHNKLLAMSVFGLAGDMGGKLRDNAMMIIYGCYAHYKYGGYFISGGSQEITRSIIPIIEASGGRCLANVCVENIIFDKKHERAIGVRATAKKGKKITEFYARYGVISSAGFVNTYRKFVDVESLPKYVSSHKKLQIQRLLTNIQPSAQHFHIFLGFNATAKQLGFPQNNRWYLLFGDDKVEDFDYDKLINDFHADPLHAPMMGFLSFPSAKNPVYEGEKATAIILTEIPHHHFSKWSDEKPDARGADYVSLKEAIANRLIEELLFKFYPSCRQHIIKKDIGTALTAKYYLGSSVGESYGLQSECSRYFDYEFNELLKPKQAIKGLWLTGTDLLCAGFASGLQSGLWCAENILGYHQLSVLLSGRNLVSDLNKMDQYQYDHKQMTNIQNYDFDHIKNKLLSQT